MKKSSLFIRYLIIQIVYILGLKIAYAAPFSKEDSHAECYTVNQNIPTPSEHCKVTFTVLNEDGNSAVTIYKNQIFRMVNYVQCDSDNTDSCYVNSESLAFGRPKKVIESEYMYLKEEDAKTYYRNKTKKLMHIDELFKPINDSWATCMKSRSYDFCIQSKYSIEKIPKLRNEF